jgi:methylated-DNA-[protein]-cysteine S-methyltransferase
MNFARDRLPTPIGILLLVFDEQDRLRALDWEDFEPRMRRLLRLQYGREVELRESGAPGAIRDSLNSYFAGDFSALDSVEVETGGTPFQRKLWAALRDIPSGQTSSYGALAAKIALPKAVRAVGACQRPQSDLDRPALPSRHRLGPAPHRLWRRLASQALAAHA